MLALRIVCPTSRAERGCGFGSRSLRVTHRALGILGNGDEAIRGNRFSSVSQNDGSQSLDLDEIADELVGGRCEEHFVGRGSLFHRRGDVAH